jgi:hypothetical protein
MGKLARERGKAVRNRPGGGGKWGANTKKILNRRNEARNLLKAKELRFSGAQNELAFAGRKSQSKRKIWPRFRQSWGVG